MSDPTLALLPDPAPASVSIRARQRTKVSQATSGRIISRAYGGQLFEMTLTYPLMTREQFAPINAFLTAQGGRNEIFYVRVPEDMSGATGQRAGNFALFSNDWKLHLITDTDPLTVIPPARVDGGTLTTSNLCMRCSLARDIQEIRVNQRGLIRYEIDLVERV